MKKRIQKKSFNKKGFTLLEVMLALAVFMLAGVSLVIALNRIFDVAIATNRLERIDIDLETRLAESRLFPLTPGWETLGPGFNDTTYKRVVSPLNLKNVDGQSLPNLYSLKITGYTKTDHGIDEHSAEIYVYQP